MLPAINGGSRLVKDVNFSSLHDRQVIFIPAINMDSYKSTAFLVEKYCAEANVRDLKILNQAVLSRSLTDVEPEKANALNHPWERYLAQNTVELNKYESIILKTLRGKALTPDKYKTLGVNMGIFESSSITEPEFKPLLTNLPALRRNVPLGDRETVTTACFGEYENATVIYGKQSSGKSILALGVASARAAGISFLDFPAERPTKVLFIDGETPGVSFLERQERMINALRCDEKLIEENLHYCLLLAEHQSKIIDLNTDYFRNLIEK